MSDVGTGSTRPFEQPSKVTLDDDGIVTVTRLDGLTVVLKPAEPPIRLVTEEAEGV